jgi:hypothetical protein
MVHGPVGTETPSMLEPSSSSTHLFREKERMFFLHSSNIETIFSYKGKINVVFKLMPSSGISLFSPSRFHDQLIDFWFSSPPFNI